LERAVDLVQIKGLGIKCGRCLTDVDVLLSTRVSATDYPNVIE
jgi:bacterioferritin-associated ferredoxin